MARATDASGNQAWASRTVTFSNSTSAPSIYWGAWIGTQFTGGVPPSDMNAAAAFESMTGKGMSLIPLWLTWMNCYSSPCAHYAFPTSAMNAVHNHGSIPFIHWGSGSSPTPRTSRTSSFAT